MSTSSSCRQTRKRAEDFPHNRREKHSAETVCEIMKVSLSKYPGARPSFVYHVITRFSEGPSIPVYGFQLDPLCRSRITGEHICEQKITGLNTRCHKIIQISTYTHAADGSRNWLKSNYALNENPEYDLVNEMPVLTLQDIFHS
ncbi:hypothetical protein P168DRAFT_280399 [Aspergillus campestris IBT 28561]|uniref:Uncharacterized protein n=1 Tax=Aspergillus campestris (strain IBT 28561) TaxID=1392248 RepID=A0A2I1D6H8_ASPC2|nr:uncharacterized protein P168DRAFT_280399 [Aspergillus campestris IBT 28561]PKY05469.1 hypothetical protein P168DRAFT_280399 [Aspergillus campestris IBT 28561]